MNTKMKDLMPPKKKFAQRKMNVFYLGKVAWNFAHALLWSEQKFTDDEIRQAKEHLITYFKEATHRKKALIAFCERIILTKNYLASKEQSVLPSPSIWLNPKYHQGFPETKGWLQAVEETRKNVPGHLKHYTVLANHYYLYCLHPSKGILQQCHDRLVDMNAKSLLQSFYTTIYHFNYINQ